MTGERRRLAARRALRLRRAAAALRRSLIVKSVPRFVGFTVLSVAALTVAAVRLATEGLTAAGVLLAGVALALLVPPAAGAARWGVLRRARTATSEVKQLREESAKLESAATKMARANRTLADWLKSTLVAPYAPRTNDCHRDFETWLNDIVIKVMAAVFPDHGTVSLALVCERNGDYTISHGSAGLPEAILAVAPAPVRRPLEECIQDHCPDARVFSFGSEGQEAWIAFFPERAPFDEVIHMPSLTIIAASVASVFFKQGLASAGPALPQGEQGDGLHSRLSER
jgi:hypothetical protein